MHQTKATPLRNYLKKLDANEVRLNHDLRVKC